MSFWMEKPEALVNSFCLIPTKDMSTQEKLNSLSRLVIVIAIAVTAFNPKIGFQFLVVGLFLLVAYNSCLNKDATNMNTTLLGVNNPNWSKGVDIGPRDPDHNQFDAQVHSAGLVGAIGNGGYGNYAPNANSNTALFVGVPFEEAQTGSLNDANSDAAMTIVKSEDPEENLPPAAGYGVGGGWGHGWAPSTGLTSTPDLPDARDGSLAYENDPGMRFLEQVSQVDGSDSYAQLSDDLVYSPYNTVYNTKPDSGYPTPPGVSGQWAPGVVPYTGGDYMNTVYVSPAQSAHPDAGSAVPNAGMPGMRVDGTQNANAWGASRLAADGLKKKASNSFITTMASNAGADSLQMNGYPLTPQAGSSSDYSDNGYSNLYSGDSGNNDPEHYVTLDKRQPINKHAFINAQNIASYQPVDYTEPIDRSERLDAKTFQLWKDLTLFDKNPSQDATNQMMDYAGTENITDQSFEPTYYKTANRREEIKKNTFSSFMNERIAQDHGIMDDVPEFRRQMMRDYTPLRRRPVSFRSGSNAPREFASPGNVPLTPLRPPMTPSPATPGF